MTKVVLYTRGKGGGSVAKVVMYARGVGGGAEGMCG